MKRFENCINYTLNIFQYIIVPKPDDSIPFGLESKCSALVSRHGVSRTVLTPVEFDNETMFLAAEIDNEIRDRELPPKLVSLKSSRP